jgi:hypothetical protein
MKASKKFQEICKIAKEKGFKLIKVSKGGKWGNTAYSYVSIDEIINVATGSNINTGRFGEFHTKANPKPDHCIGYQSAFRKFEKNLMSL